MVFTIQEAVKDRGRKSAKAAPKQTKADAASKKQFYLTVALFLVLGLVIWAIAYSVRSSKGLFVKELATGGALLFFSVLFQQFDGKAAQ